MNIIDRSGKLLTTKEVREVIMRAQGLSTKAEYEKFYDVFRNRLRTFEKKTASTERESPLKVLYYESESKLRVESAGKQYQPSYKFSRIQSTPALSSGKQSTEYAKREVVQTAEKDILNDRMAAFIGSLPISYQKKIGEVYEKSDYKTYKQMLEDLASKYAEKKKSSDTGAPQYRLSSKSYSYGTVNFTFSNYLN